jgi:hypothetical protein
MRALPSVLVVALILFNHCILFGQTSDLEQPAGLVVDQDKVLITDAQTGKILEDAGNGAGYELFATDPKFKSPTAIAASSKAFYVADPGAQAVFRLDKKSREVTQVWKGAPLGTPTDVAITSRPIIKEGRISTEEELLVLDSDTGFIFHTSLDSGSHNLVRLETAPSFIRPVAIWSGEGRIALADKAANTIFESNHGELWQDLGSSSTDLELSKPTDSSFFPQLTGPTAITYHEGIYYVLDQSRVYALSGEEFKPIPLVFDPKPLIDPRKLAVSHNKILISDAAKKEIQEWPLLLPVTITVESRLNTSEAQSALYGYLWERGILPTTEVTLQQYHCEYPSCVVLKRQLLLSGYVQAMDEILCSYNKRVCNNGKWSVREHEKLTIPLLPFDKYVGVMTRELDGKSSVKSYVDQWVSQELRPLVTEDLLKRLNPDLAHTEILSLSNKGLKVHIPIVRYEYYVTAPKEDIDDIESPLWKVLKRYPILRLRSMTTVKGGASNSGVDDPLIESTELKKDYSDALEHAHHSIESTESGEDVDVLLYERDVHCQHPVFFNADDSNTSAAFYSQDCTNSGLHLDGKVAASFDTHYHGTCIASIVGARRLPYGFPLAHSVRLRECDSEKSLDDTTKFTYDVKKSQPIVNVSQESRSLTERSSWEKRLADFYGKNSLYVVAAGNDNKSLGQNPIYPGSLARESNNMISVGALNAAGDGPWVDKTGKQGSNFGNQVDIFAPGELIPCAAGVIEPNKPLYARPSGTSMATAFVSAVASLLAEKGLYPRQIKDRIIATGIPVEWEKDGEGLSYAGALNIDRAISNPKEAHLITRDGRILDGTMTLLESQTELEATTTETINHSPRHYTINLENLQTITRLSSDPPLYRVAHYITKMKLVVEKADLAGCLAFQSNSDGKQYLVVFSDGTNCHDFNEWDGERDPDPQALIFPVDPRVQ